MESLSIVVPCYNSSGRLSYLVSEILKIISEYEYEIILVNDGSTDNTWDEIKKLSELHPEVKGICFSVNMGQQNAVFSGLYYSSADYIITMDDDMEHDPKEIANLINKADEGYDLVYTAGRKKYSLFRKAGSFAHNLFFYAAFRKPFKLKITSFRIMRRNLADKIILTDKYFIYISAIALSFKPHASCITTDTVTIKESRYSYIKLADLFIRLILNYAFPDFFYSLINKTFFPERKTAAEKIKNNVSEICGELNK